MRAEKERALAYPWQASDLAEAGNEAPPEHLRSNKILPVSDPRVHALLRSSELAAAARVHPHAIVTVLDTHHLALRQGIRGEG